MGDVVIKSKGVKAEEFMKIVAGCANVTEVSEVIGVSRCIVSRAAKACGIKIPRKQRPRQKRPKKKAECSKDGLVAVKLDCMDGCGRIIKVSMLAEFIDPLLGRPRGYRRRCSTCDHQLQMRLAGSLTGDIYL